MRMWNVDPNLLCRKHLLGEHREMHMLANAICKKRSIAGYLAKGLVEPESIECSIRDLLARCNECAQRMKVYGLWESEEK